MVAAVAGGVLTRSHGLLTGRRVGVARARGQLPAVELMEGVVILVGGVLFFIPGFISDAIGLLCLIPPVRRGAVLWLLRHAIAVGPAPRDGRGPPAGPRTIEGDFRREEERLP